MTTGNEKPEEKLDQELDDQLQDGIEEEDALERLQQFQTHLVLDKTELLGEQPLSLPELRGIFVAAQLKNRPLENMKPKPNTVVDLNPIEQKRAIARAKEGELRSLKLIHNYKSWRIRDLSTPQEKTFVAPQKSEAASPKRE